MTDEELTTAASKEDNIISLVDNEAFSKKDEAKEKQTDASETQDTKSSHDLDSIKSDSLVIDELQKL